MSVQHTLLISLEYHIQLLDFMQRSQIFHKCKLIITALKDIFVSILQKEKLRQRAFKLPVNGSDIAAHSLSSLPTIIMPVKVWQSRHFFLRSI